MRDIDTIIQQLAKTYPDITHEQLKVLLILVLMTMEFGFFVILIVLAKFSWSHTPANVRSFLNQIPETPRSQRQQ